MKERYDFDLMIQDLINQLNIFYLKLDNLKENIYEGELLIKTPENQLPLTQFKNPIILETKEILLALEYAPLIDQLTNLEQTIENQILIAISDLEKLDQHIQSLQKYINQQEALESKEKLSSLLDTHSLEFHNLQKSVTETIFQFSELQKFNTSAFHNIQVRLDTIDNSHNQLRALYKRINQKISSIQKLKLILIFGAAISLLFSYLQIQSIFTGSIATHVENGGFPLILNQLLNYNLIDFTHALNLVFIVFAFSMRPSRQFKHLLSYYSISIVVSSILFFQIYSYTKSNIFDFVFSITMSLISLLFLSIIFMVKSNSQDLDIAAQLVKEKILSV